MNELRERLLDITTEWRTTASGLSNQGERLRLRACADQIAALLSEAQPRGRERVYRRPTDEDIRAALNDPAVMDAIHRYSMPRKIDAALLSEELRAMASAIPLAAPASPPASREPERPWLSPERPDGLVNLNVGDRCIATGMVKSQAEAIVAYFSHPGAPASPSAAPAERETEGILASMEEAWGAPVILERGNDSGQPGSAYGPPLTLYHPDSPVPGPTEGREREALKDAINALGLIQVTAGAARAGLRALSSAPPPAPETP